MENSLIFFIQKHIDGLIFFKENISEQKIKSFLDFLNQPHKNIYFTGIGKNGHVAAKAASTFNSMGINVSFINPVDAVHGDIGIISENDIILVVSKSGNTEELVNFLFYANKRTKKIGLIHSNHNNQSLKFCEFDFFVDLLFEADHLNKIPTVSIAVYTVLLQSIACLFAEKNKLSLSELVFNHPGGSIGKSFN